MALTILLSVEDARLRSSKKKDEDPNEKNNSKKIAHTAEHAFIGSLQKLLEKTLLVRKVSHLEDGSNTAFIVTSTLNLQTVLKAQSEVNSLILEGRPVRSHLFNSMEDAKREMPSLRANEERISGKVRVVEIARHDVAACAMEHADDLSQCGMFLVTRISKSGDEFEVDFVVGEEAKKVALELSAKMLRVCLETGANFNTVENTVAKLRSGHQASQRSLRAITREILQNNRPEKTRDGVLIFRGNYSELSIEELREFAGEKISEVNSIVIIATLHRDSRMANLVFARSESLSHIDCNKIFNEAIGTDGRGGGTSHYATGVVSGEAVKKVLQRLSAAVVK